MKDFANHRRALQSIAQGALTNSKRPESHVMGVYPTHVGMGLGATCFGEDGQRYIDYICGLGTNLLGWGNSKIAWEIQKRLHHGYCLSFGTNTEIEAAELLKEFFPFVESVKFLKTGTEACMAAVRIARAVTGRKVILSEGYHGWSDGFVSLTPPASGCVRGEDMRFYKLMNFEQINKLVAAVIVEPVITDTSDARRKWIEDLREKCTKEGVLLIFDEIITGFRYENFGVCNQWNIVPDLICLGKALGGGMPLSAVAGKYVTMNDPSYFVSSTFAGEILSLAASIGFMREIRNKHANIVTAGRKFSEDFNKLNPRVQIAGYATRGSFIGDPLDKALFFQEACAAGILFGPSWFFCDSHIGSEDIVLASCTQILKRLDRGELKLRGEMPAAPFAQKVREGK
jgi:glutamate-1-semialdehyde aminotransferase